MSHITLRFLCEDRCSEKCDSRFTSAAFGGETQSGVDSAKNNVFWQKVNFNYCKKLKFICSRKTKGREAIEFFLPRCRT